MKDTGLRGKVVVVTGAAAGIGLATARRFAGEGCRVAAWDVNDAGQYELLRELSSFGGEALFRKVSVCSDGDVEAAVAGDVAQAHALWRGSRPGRVVDRGLEGAVAVSHEDGSNREGFVTYRNNVELPVPIEISHGDSGCRDWIIHHGRKGSVRLTHQDGDARRA